MPNAWMNHVKNFRRQNRHLSYKQLLREARKTYGGGDPVGVEPKSALTRYSSRIGGGVMGNETPSSLTRSASRVGGVRSNDTPSSLTRSASRVGGSRRRQSRRRRS